MNWLSNIRMAYKILCLTLVAAIGLAAVSVNGFTSLQNAEKTVDKMSTVYLPATSYLAEGQINVRKVQSAMLEAIATPLPERRQKMKKDLNENYTNGFLENWNAYKELVKNDAELSAKAAELDKAWDEYRATSNQVIELTIADKKDEASALYAGDGIKKLNAIKNGMVELQEECKADIAAADEANEAESAATNRRMIIISIVAFIILFIAANYIIREITSALKAMIAVCDRLKDGDFRKDGADLARGDELGDMWNAIAAVRDNLHNLMAKFNDTAQQLAAASEELTASSQQSAEASNQVAGSVTDAAAAADQQQGAVASASTAVTQVAGSVRSVEDATIRVNEEAQTASDQAQQGAVSVDDAITQIKRVEDTVKESTEIVDKLGKRSQEIGQIVDTISEIADQTNLLALNAAIEAARAGEYGRGFAVVADEVRKLAEQSQEAAARIADLIGGIQQDTTHAVDSMKLGSDRVVEGAEAVAGLKETFGEIVGLIEQIAQDISGISESMRGVSSDTTRITDAVGSLNEHSQSIAAEMQSVSAATEEQTASAQDIAQASDSLARLAQDLQLAIQVFKL